MAGEPLAGAGHIAPRVYPLRISAAFLRLSIGACPSARRVRPVGQRPWQIAAGGALRVKRM